MYLLLKHLHVTCVALSGLGFCLRGYWMLVDSPLLTHRWTRVLPHGVDTLLLGSAIALAVLTGQYPFVQPWLTAKVLGLLAYIVLGSLALKRGRTKGQRTCFLVLALLVFVYIVLVALRRSPLPFA